LVEALEAPNSRPLTPVGFPGDMSLLDDDYAAAA